jgi:hypothetical protein
MDIDCFWIGYLTTSELALFLGVGQWQMPNSK